MATIYKIRKAKIQVKRWGIKLWSIKKTDIEFSKWLRNSRGKCEYCGTTEGLTCSHYIGRREYATRWDPKNCDSFCFSCHSILESRKQYAYRNWKIATMGEEAHALLEVKKHSAYKGVSEAIYETMQMLNKIT